MIVSELQAKLDKMPKMAEVEFDGDVIAFVRQVGTDKVALISSKPTATKKKITKKVKTKKVEEPTLFEL